MFIYSIQNAKNNYDMHEEKKNVEIIFPKINIVEQCLPQIGSELPKYTDQIPYHIMRIILQFFLIQ